MTDKTNVTPLASAKSSEKASSGKGAAAAASAAQKAAPAAQPAPGAKDMPGAAAKAGHDEAIVETRAPIGVALADLPWQMIEAGHVVLAADHSEGEFQGWWPAKVISRTADAATCEFLGYEHMGRFTKSIIALSLMHPAHKD